MYELSANLELLFTEAGDDYGDRVRAAADAGCTAVEIWSATDKDLPRLGRALSETGLDLCTMIVEPRARLALEEEHESFLAGVRASADRAKELGCPRLVITSGAGLPSRTRAQQHATLVDVLRKAADLIAGEGVTLVLENLNTRVDHPGSLLDVTADCLEVIRGVDSPDVALLYDLYHSVAMGESPAEVLQGAIGLVSHVQIADCPGRGEPGTGDIDWAQQLRALRDLGYQGRLGLEYFPVQPSVESLALIRQLAEAV
ncbi:TIM barrel protein [Streptomyces sp. N2-109]|uniref:TIM barrel protein n=1 Tax=Streptomyces gossypii TaxID=2883101 RepID=A0ABT2K0T9_9ACTN|nr:TIM barrel protein [Streptomyces gossypii]MCT2593523.1 TIM barrel protein [Streptomyces gossypii]